MNKKAIKELYYYDTQALERVKALHPDYNKYDLGEAESSEELDFGDELALKNLGGGWCGTVQAYRFDNGDVIAWWCDNTDY